MRASRYGLLALILLVATAGAVVVALQVKRKSFSPSETVSASPPIQSRQEGIEAEEYAVLSAVIKDRERQGDTAPLLVIEESPSPWITSVNDGQGKFYEEMKKGSPKLLAETVDDLRAKNNDNYKFLKNFDIGHPYALISDEEFQSFFKGNANDGWKRFYEKYPKSGGIVTFSRVGFNADKTQALVYRGHRCGALCGEGLYYLLSKKNGAWVLDGNVGPSWIS